ncbi:MAG TPA: glycosyltransferase [Solirubrobacteraceae bacterium]|nr:glycosyltransferase [Solirubrobacteraceae bacterium]
MLRALVVTNMYPSPARPALGGSVRDQVPALERIDDLDVQPHAFVPGSARSYICAARDLRRRFAGETFDVVHAHFGHPAWPSLAVRARHRVATLHGNDVHHARSRPITLAHLAAGDPRVRRRPLQYSAGALAERVATAWRWLASGGQAPPLYSPAEAPTQPSPAAPPS